MSADPTSTEFSSLFDSRAAVCRILQKIEMLASDRNRRPSLQQWHRVHDELKRLRTEFQDEVPLGLLRSLDFLLRGMEKDVPEAFVGDSLPGHEKDDSDTDAPAP